MNKITTFVDNRMLNNTYLLKIDRQVLIIDPSFSTKEIKNYITKNNLEVLAILLTHGHFDHFAGVEELGNLYNCPYYISREDEGFLYDRSKSHAPNKMNMLPVIFPKEELSIGDFHLELIATPGHSLGSIVIVWEKSMFTGDFLFHGDIGRTDLPGSSHQQMVESLKMFAKIETDYKIYPGHEEGTSLKQEQINNPYLNRYV